MPPQSKRSLLLAHLHQENDGSRTCIHCSDLVPTRFNAGSGATAWSYHLKEKHKSVWANIEAQTRLQQDDGAGSVSTSTGNELSSPGPPHKKQRTADSSESIASSSSGDTPSIREHFSVQHTAPLTILARALTMGGIAYRFVESVHFRDFLTAMKWHGPLPSRRGVKNSVHELSSELRSKLIVYLQSTPNPISIALDGWTNVQHNKVTNVVLLAGGCPFYWTSIVNKMESNTAEWVFQRLLPIIEELITKHRLRIVAVAADNEAVNGALIRKVALPFLVHAPCAAHTVQLVVKNVLESASFLTTVEQLHDLLSFFNAKEHRNALKQLQDVRRVKPLCLKKPNDTRWSSTFMAVERVLEMKKELNAALSCRPFPTSMNFLSSWRN